jgi:hypothetical protein
MKSFSLQYSNLRMPVFHTLTKMLVLTVLLLVFPRRMQAQVDETGPLSLPMSLDGNTLRIPYFADFPVDSVNYDVNKVVVVVHGMDRNAGDYFRSMKKAEAMSSHFTDSVTVVAPQFLEEEDLDPNNLDDSYLYWSSGWKSGSNSKNNSGHPRSARISSYAVMDTLLLHLAGHLPHLKYIVLTGHSAGAQLVNRYAASSPEADFLFRKYGIQIRFIVANPGSDKLHVEITGDFVPQFYSVIDGQGRVLIAPVRVKNKSFFIRLNTLPHGIYFLKLENKKITVTKEFSKN